MNKILLVLSIGLISLASSAKNPYVDDTQAQVVRAAQDLLKKNNKIEFAGLWKSDNDVYQAKQILEMVEIFIVLEGEPELNAALQALAQQLKHFIDAPTFAPQR